YPDGRDANTIHDARTCGNEFGCGPGDEWACASCLGAVAHYRVGDERHGLVACRSSVRATAVRSSSPRPKATACCHSSARPARAASCWSSHAPLARCTSLAASEKLTW